MTLIAERHGDEALQIVAKRGQFERVREAVEASGRLDLLEGAA